MYVCMYVVIDDRIGVDVIVVKMGWMMGIGVGDSCCFSFGSRDRLR